MISSDADTYHLPSEQQQERGKESGYLITASALLISIILILSIVYSGAERTQFYNEAYEELQLISELKARQVEVWIEERRSDALLLAAVPNLRIAAKAGNREFISELSESPIELLRKMVAENNYEEALVITNKGEVLISTNSESDTVSFETRSLIDEIIQTNSVIFSDFYRCSLHNRIHLDVGAPIPELSGITEAVVILRIDPNIFLYPLIQTWPTFSKSAETLLIRKSGNDSIEFINELRHLSNTALNLKVVADTSGRLPAAVAVAGHTGTYEGVDYRGKEVLSHLLQIPGTNWHMVSKVDKTEITKELRSHKRVVSMMAGMMIITVLFFTAWQYDRRKKQTLKRNLEAEKKISNANELFRVTLYSIGDAVITTDSAGVIVQMNPVAETLTGWKESEAVGKPLSEVFIIINEDTRRDVESPVERVLREGKVVGLANHTLLISRDGKERPIADSGAPIIDKANIIKGVVLVFRDQTEERQAETKLKEHARELGEARRKLSTLMGNLPGIVYRCKNDKEWTMEYLSEGCLALTGFNHTELIDNKVITYGDLIDKTFTDYVWTNIQDAVAERRNFQLTYKIRTKAGSEKWVWEQGTPVFENGALVALEGFITDITEKKKAEDIVRENEKRFRSLIDISQYEAENIQDMLDFALSEAIRLTSSSLGYIYHYSEEEEKFVLNTWSDNVMKECSIQPPETCYELEKTGIWGEAVRQRKEIVINDFQAGHPLKKGYPDGHAKLWNYLTVPIFERNKIIAVVGVANKPGDYSDADINQLKLLMDSVWKLVGKRKTEEQIRQMSKALEQSPVSIVITDSEGRIVYVNPRFTTLTGYSAEDVSGKMSRILKAASSDASELKTLWPDISSGNEWKGEYQNRKKDGEQFWEMVTIQAVRTEKEDVSNYVIVSEDITDRKVMLAELIRAKEKAEEINNLKSRFLANMSHELRTPMNGILGFSELLTGENNIYEIRKMSEIINKSANRLMRTLNSILDLSRIESGAGETVLADTDISLLIRETAELFRSEAGKKNLSLIIEGADEPVIIRTDPRIAGDIFNNLVNNAIKFTFTGGIRVILHNRCKSSEASMVIEVHDTGIGISEKDQAIIFDEFRQANEGFSRTFDGTGLGLSICRKYLTLLGGTISVDSQLGKGSVFRVVLPCNQ